MSKNLSQIAKSKKIKYFLISFVDLFGVLRSKLVPKRAIKEMQKTRMETNINNHYVVQYMSKDLKQLCYIIIIHIIYHDR